MVPQIIHFNRVFHHKPSILGYPYFWKHPYGLIETITILYIAYIGVYTLIYGYIDFMISCHYGTVWIDEQKTLRNAKIYNIV